MGSVIPLHERLWCHQALPGTAGTSLVDDRHRTSLFQCDGEILKSRRRLNLEDLGVMKGQGTCEARQLNYSSARGHGDITRHGLFQAAQAVGEGANHLGGNGWMGIERFTEGVAVQPQHACTICSGANSG